jgi:hydroxymethylbilane synthase
MAPSGDRASTSDAVAGADKSRWVLELEQALQAGEIDLAVHSAKDVPARLADGLELLGAPPRAPAEDAICGAPALGALPEGARVGTSSVRRSAQLLAARPDLELTPVRGNVDTRLRKRRELELDALVLARAGLIRLGREQEIGGVLDWRSFVPAPGQGTLAIEGRAGDGAARAEVEGICDADTFTSLLAERALARELDAGCHTPLGAHAALTGPGRLRLLAWVGLPDGSSWIRDELEGDADAPQELAAQLALRLRAVGAAELLRAAEEASAVGGA